MQGEEVFSLFPHMLREMLGQMGVRAKELREIRIRAGRPLLALGAEREYLSRECIQGAQLGEILAYLGNYSLYAYEEEIRQGFLSLPGGHRVGLAGRAVTEQGRLKTLTEISSLNIRFAHEVKGCAGELLPFLWQGNRLCHTLIASAPGQGKTTLLRDCIRQLSDGSPLHAGLTVGVVDERSEIAGSCRGVPGNDVGVRTDVLDGCPKAEGMMMLIRSMAPDVVAVDEIGSADDVSALQYAMHCGCVLLATVHGNSIQELKKRPVLCELAASSLFERYVFLEAGKRPGHIGRILDAEGRELPMRKTGC